MNDCGKVDAIAERLLRTLLPLRCLLCGGAGEAGLDLCAACRAELPRNAPCCPRCALPLATPAAACGACLRRAPPFTTAWAPLRYGHPLDLLETRFKFHADLAAGRVLAALLCAAARRDAPARPALIIPIPLHAARLRQRGYNQALELVRPLARDLDVELAPRLLVRTRATPPQTGLDAAARRRNLRDAFALAPGASVPAHVVVFDDVMTTGATLREAARCLRRAGVARVDAWALARAPQR